MCLYERRLRNAKYETTLKNKGNVPKCEDARQLHIKVGCGWCEECRKKIANNWKVRLYEELKENPKAIMVNLSFSPESIDKLETEIYNKKYLGIEPDENGELQLDVNILASYAVRMWTERFRKRNKKAPRHFLVTELGHKNSERIHLHGIVWNTTTEEIEKTWKYGNIVFGTWVDNRTINYIIKYITKLDEYHEGYKQKTLVSKGLGKSYINKNKNIHKYKGEDTITYYKSYNGFKLGLPRYWKEKLWTEEERAAIWSIEMDKNKTYIGQQEYNTDNTEENYIEEFRRDLATARDYNNKTGFGNNKTPAKKYIITDIMKMKYKETIDYNREKLVKCVNARKLVSIDKSVEDTKISKTMDTNIYHWGTYKGNLTEAKRNLNKLIEEANEIGISVKKLRLIKAGLINM